MRAIERLFIFAIVSIASLLVFKLHEKHAELHKRDGEWSVRKDLQQVVEKEKINVFDTNAPRELRKALSEEKLNNYGARVRSGIEEPSERIIDSLRNRIESETGEKKVPFPPQKLITPFPLPRLFYYNIGHRILPKTLKSKMKLEKPCVHHTVRMRSMLSVSMRYNLSLYVVRTIKAAFPLLLSTP